MQSEQLGQILSLQLKSYRLNLTSLKFSPANKIQIEAKNISNIEKYVCSSINQDMIFSMYKSTLMRLNSKA
jgi:hypothetical protein